MLCAIGTTSEQKLGYVRTVCRRLGLRAKLVPYAAPSGVPDQPLTSAVTKRGAVHRARAAFRAVAGADLALGIEVGYQKDRSGRYHMLCWAVVFDGRRTVVQQSHAFRLPDFHHDTLMRGQELGDVVRQYHAGTQDPIRLRVGELIRTRDAFIVSALEHALLQYFGC